MANLVCNKKPNLTESEVNGVIQLLIVSLNDKGKPKHGSMGVIAARFNVCQKTVTRIWNQAKSGLNQGVCPIVLGSKKKVRAHKLYKPFDEERFKLIPYSKKKSMRFIAKNMDVCAATVYRWFKQGKLIAHSSAIKPALLSENNQLHRIKFCLEHLKVNVQDKVIEFVDMQHTLHMDEKWFYLSNVSDRFYLCPGEKIPHRVCQNKRFITKVMFLTVVGRPLCCSVTEECLWNGKIGIYPFTQRVPAARTSKNRARGTIETKVVDVVTKKLTTEFIIQKVIPDIIRKWPPMLSKNIFIQQDNARPHIADDEEAFRAAADVSGFNIHLVFQPPNSPDTNVLNLGWFRALQSLQVETSAYTIDELLEAVVNAFDDLEVKKLNYVFLSLQNVMIEIMKNKGENSYRLPHMKKDALLRAGNLPLVLQVDVNLVRESMTTLVDGNYTEGLQNFIDDVGRIA